MKINPSKSVQENILDLIHDSNPDTVDSLTLDKVTIGSVSAVINDPSGKNSQVEVIAKANLGYSQSVVVKFDRLGMDSGVKTVPTTITILPSDTQAERVTKIAAILGLKESEVIITGVGGGVIGTPSDEDDTSVSAVVSPKANSSLYVGSQLVIQLTVPNTDVDLNSIITDRTLNGFQPVS